MGVDPGEECLTQGGIVRFAAPGDLDELRTVHGQALES